jgi:hypothetical protein
MQAVVSGLKPPLGKLRSQLPSGLVSVVDKAMATKPEDRYATVDDLLKEVARFAGASARAAHAGSALLLLL